MSDEEELESKEFNEEETIGIQPIEIEEDNIEDSQLEYIEKTSETVYHWFYPNNVTQDRAKDIAEETFGISNPEIYQEDMFESITVILDYVDNKDYEERHEALVRRCG